MIGDEPTPKPKKILHIVLSVCLPDDADFEESQEQGLAVVLNHISNNLTKSKDSYTFIIKENHSNNLDPFITNSTLWNEQHKDEVTIHTVLSYAMTDAPNTDATASDN